MNRIYLHEFEVHDRWAFVRELLTFVGGLLVLLGVFVAATVR